MIKRVLIAGCRNYNDYECAKRCIDYYIKDIRQKYELVFVSGGCRGADLLGERYAEENGFSVEIYPADWAKFGRKAGPIRNKLMAEVSDYIICFWDGKSAGTKSMIECAKRTNKPLKVKLI